jgi:hypothetical protein
VTNSDLTTAISSTSSNSNSVNTLDSSFPDTDVEELRLKLNELITALRR